MENTLNKKNELFILFHFISKMYDENLLKIQILQL